MTTPNAGRLGVGDFAVLKTVGVALESIYMLSPRARALDRGDGAKYLQMVGDGWLCQLQMSCQFRYAHTMLRLSQYADELVAAPLADHLEALGAEFLFCRDTLRDPCGAGM